MYKLFKKKRLRSILALALLLVFGTLVSLGYFKYIYKADEATPPPVGTTEVTNITTNAGATDSTVTLVDGVPQVPKYDKFELTFDINRLDKPADQANPIVTNNLNTEIDANTINPYWPYDENPAPNTYYNANHPEWDSNKVYTVGNDHVSHNGTIYGCIKTTSNPSVEPGVGEGWQEYWLASPADPIQAKKGISVDVLFSNDNFANVKDVTAFYYQDYSNIVYSTSEAFVPKGIGQWKARFAPPELGNWQYKIVIRDFSGLTNYSDSALTMNAIASSNHGFAQVSPTDSRYFELSDGTTLLAPGVQGDFTRYNKLSEVDQAVDKYSTNGVKSIRYWMDYRGWQSPFAGGSGGGGPQWSFSLETTPKSGYKAGDKFSGILTAPTGTDIIRSVYQDVYLQAQTLYRFTGYVRTEGMADSTTFGIYPSVSGNSTAARGDYISGATNWTQFSFNYTPTASKSYRFYLNNNASVGTAYFDEFSLKGSTDQDATWSSELMVKGDMDVQNYINQKDSYIVDYIFQKAEEKGIYIKTVLSEKQDTSLGSIASDGTAVPYAENNFYANDHSASRWLQQTWWRYANARWGSYTSLHSWELCNEGDPFNGNHTNTLDAFAKAMHTNFYKATMATTSFWHSLPMDTWKNTAADYIDLHEYFGPQTVGTGSRGPIYYAWGEPQIVPSSNSAGSIDFDSITKYAGVKSIKLTAKDGATGNSSNWYNTSEFHTGIDPTHKYTLRYWAKAQNIGNAGGGLSWTLPNVGITWSSGYHNNDFKGWPNCTEKNPGLGTYDWTEFYCTNMSPPVDANTANINFNVTRNQTGAGDGIFWIDNVSFLDQTTNKELFVDGGFENDQVDFDTALATMKYGLLENSFGTRISKPGVWGETGIRGLDVFGTPYKGYAYTDENQQVLDDTDGVFLRKLLWANLGPDNTNLYYWFTDAMNKNNMWPSFKSFQNFLSGISLSDGKYKDVAAQSPNGELRVLGQKELTNGKAEKAHLWIDNKAYTWKAVVDNKFNLADTVWKNNVTYDSDSICTYDSKFYQSKQNSNLNHLVTEIDFWTEISQADFLKTLDMTTLNPPLPPPASGTITIPNMKVSQAFKLEWWDTSQADPTKQIIATTGTGDSAVTLPAIAVSDISGNLVIPVSNLVSDIALKISVSSVTPLDKPIPSVTPKAMTYKDSYKVTGTKSSSVTKVLVNSTYATITNTNDTWEATITLNPGNNVITVIGQDDTGRQSEPVILETNRHRVGDINGDGHINATDLAGLNFNWGKTDVNNPANFNEDDTVGAADLAGMNYNWMKW